MTIALQLASLISLPLSVEASVKTDFLTRVTAGNVLRSEDPVSHFCVYMVPFIRSKASVFLGHHKKANSWIAPGGHIEPEHETPIATVMQESREELGIELSRDQISEPFFLSVHDVFSPGRACRRHYSIWYAVFFEEEIPFVYEEREFYDAKWMSITHAKEIIEQKENSDALDVLLNLY